MTTLLGEAAIFFHELRMNMVLRSQNSFGSWNVPLQLPLADSIKSQISCEIGGNSHTSTILEMVSIPTYLQRAICWQDNNHLFQQFERATRASAHLYQRSTYAADLAKTSTRLAFMQCGIVAEDF